MEGPTLMHAQYNSPLPLYSQRTAQEELERATGQPSPRPQGDVGSKFDLEHQSGAYRLLHGGGQLPSEHSVRLDEPAHEYPPYKGYVDPNLQSPSFKRLQHYAGVDESAAGAPHHSPAASLPRKSPVPQWFPENPAVAQRDPASLDERDHPLDPDFARKIAEAERPKVPAPVVPSWANKTYVKQSRWEENVAQQAPSAPAPFISGQREEQWPAPALGTQRLLETAAPQPPALAPKPALYKTVPGPTQAEDKWQQHYSHFGMEMGASGPRSPARRPHSVEPQGWRQRPDERQPWMKPYVAPNVLNTKFSSSPESYRTMGQSARPSSQAGQPIFGGAYYGPQDAGYSTKKTVASSFRKHQEYTQPGKSAQDFSYGTYKQGLPSGQPEYPTPHNEPAPFWAQKSDQTQRNWGSTYGGLPPSSGPKPTAPWTGPSGGDIGGEPLFRSEPEAWRRKQEMEEEVRRRVTDPTLRPPSGQPHSIGGQVEPMGQKWQDASGARTKSQTHGSYVDDGGNQVNYVKEVYTSSDPGTEFSMLTQEEKKALEQPMEPGVVSRHVTSKYYKKSTYTNQTTTTNNPPVISQQPGTFHEQSGGQPHRGPSSYQIGEVAPGLSQF